MKYNRKKISIVVPTKNEGEGLRKIIQSLKKYSGEIIIVDANSQDNTRDIAKKEKAIFLLDNQKGKGEAVRIGINKAKGDIIVIFDADGSPDHKDIPKLAKPIFKNKADMVISSRRIGGSYDFEISLTGILRTMGSDFMAFLVNKKFKTNFSDILYCFRAIRKDILNELELNANGFDIEQEMLIKSLKKKYRIIEIPSREYARKWGESKLSTVAGLKLLAILIKQLYL